MGEELPIPFGAGQASGLEELSGASPVLRNFLVDPAGAMYVRPGIQAWSDFGAAPVNSPVIGIFPWRQWLLFVTGDRQIWAWQSPGSVVALSDATAATKLDGTGRPIWTYDSTRVVVTGGGAPQQWQAVGLSSRLVSSGTAPSGAPITFTHIAYSAQRLIGNLNDNSGTLQWTAPGPGNHTVWPIVGAYFAEAEAAPDPVVAVYANSNEVFAFGSQSLQTYIPDSTAAFAVATAVSAGCSTPYAVIETDSAFAWLDERRRFVQSAGRDVTVLSSPGMARDLGKADFDITGAWGFRCRIASFDLLVLVFPAEERTLWYDRVTHKWGEWDSLTATGESQSWIAQCYLYWPERNIHLVGLSDGRIAELTFNAFQDDGNTIDAVARTGFQDRGSFMRKLCQCARLQLKRGSTIPGVTAPVVELRYRDNLATWRTAKRWDMGAGDYDAIPPATWMLGEYRNREWELRFSNASEFVMTGATESFERGDS